jgi:ankyrin repeat protein
MMKRILIISTILSTAFAISACDVGNFFTHYKTKEDFSMSTDSKEIQGDLVSAVRYRNIDSLNRLLADGISANIMVNSSFEKSGEVLLLLSLLNSRYADNEDLTEHAKVIELLLQYGADVSARNDDGLGVFHLAAKNNRTDVIDMLLTAGTDPGMKDKYGQTAPFYAYSPAEIERFLNKGIGSIEDKDKWGNSLLHNSVTGFVTNLELVSWLADRVDVNARSNSKETALWKSMKAMNPLLSVNEITEILVEKGADLSTTDDNGQTLLMLALQRGDIEPSVIDLLLNKEANYEVFDHKGKAAVHYATRSVKYLESLHRAGANINEKTVGKGRTPLMLSILEGGAAQVSFLLGIDVKLNEKDVTERMALNHAIDSGNQYAVQLLEKRGAHKTQDDIVAKANLAYEIEQAKPKTLLEAINSKDLVLTKMFYRLEDGAGDLDVVEAGFKAVSVGYLEGLEYLLDEDLSINDLKKGYSLLHYAAFHNKPEIVKYLVEKGLDPNYLNQKDNRSVFKLSTNSSVEMYELLLSLGMEFNPEYDQKIVDEAIRYESYELATLLIAQGYSFDAKKYFDPDFLEDDLVREQNVELLGFLIAQGFDINTRFNKLLTYGNILTLSIKLGAHDMIEPILKAGIDVNEYVENKSIIKIAISDGRLETIELLLKYHPDLDLNVMGGNASDSEMNALLESLDKQRESMVMHFLGKEMDFNKAGTLDKRAIHVAAKLGAQKVVKILLSKEVELNHLDSWERTALMYAVSAQHDDVSKMILNYDPDVNVKGERGNTALHYAAAHGKLDIVNLMITKGAKLLKNDEGKTALDNAKKYEYSEVIESLENLI